MSPFSQHHRVDGMYHVSWRGLIYRLQGGGDGVERGSRGRDGCGNVVESADLSSAQRELRANRKKEIDG